MSNARNLANIISGGFTADDIPSLDASKITTGTITPSDNTVTNAKIVDSTIQLAKLSATGTKDATTFLRGDNSFASAGLSGWSEDGANNNLLPASSSAGIYLGVNSATASNLLDDYEEGTWTPTILTSTNGFSGDPTPSSTSGRYTKIGRLVYCTGTINFDSTQIHNEFSYIDGLPFTTDNREAGGVYNTSGAADGNATGFVRVGLSTNRCSLVENDIAIDGNSTFIFNVTYMQD